MGAANVCACACAVLVCGAGRAHLGGIGHAARQQRGPRPTPTSPHALRQGPLTPHRSECCASPRPPHARAQPLLPPAASSHHIFTPPR
eukprot:6546114-Prymnesium_polylepis.1